MPKLPQWVVPTWLERLGRASWLALGLAIAVVVMVWLFAATRTITLPLLLAVLVAAVCFPVVDWLQRRRVPAGPRRSSSSRSSSWSRSRSSLW